MENRLACLTSELVDFGFSDTLTRHNDLHWQIFKKILEELHVRLVQLFKECIYESNFISR